MSGHEDRRFVCYPLHLVAVHRCPHCCGCTRSGGTALAVWSRWQGSRAIRRWWQTKLNYSDDCPGSPRRRQQWSSACGTQMLSYCQSLNAAPDETIAVTVFRPRPDALASWRMEAPERWATRIMSSRIAASFSTRSALRPTTTRAEPVSPASPSRYFSIAVVAAYTSASV